MIKTPQLARYFFACLQDMDINRVCFDSDGNLVFIYGCDACPYDGNCSLYSYDAQDMDSAEYFADDFLR